MIDVSSDAVTRINPVFVTCTNFFFDDGLVFVVNGSARVNVRTILGVPLFTNGTWNGDNQTTSLLLDGSVVGELSWVELEPSPSPNDFPTPTPTPDKSGFFSMATILIIVGVEAVLVAGLVFAFKKGLHSHKSC